MHENRNSTCKGISDQEMTFHKFHCSVPSWDTNSNIGLLAFCEFLAESELMHLSTQTLPYYLLSRSFIVGRIQWWVTMYERNRSLWLMISYAHWHPKIVRANCHTLNWIFCSFRWLVSMKIWIACWREHKVVGRLTEQNKHSIVNPKHKVIGFHLP